MAKNSRRDLAEVVACFEDLEDPRSSVNLHHPLPSVVVIALMAVLAGADGPTGICRWAEAKEELLLRVLSLPYGLPKKDVFRRVLMALDPQAFQACFVEWLKLVRSKSEQKRQDEHEGNPPDRSVLAVDGKTLRGSHDRKNGLGALHLVSVWLTDIGLTLAQVSTEEKSNEITAIPDVLKLIDIDGAIITIDAMGTQTAITEQIVEGSGDYVLALKGNHSKLHDAVIEYVDEHLNDDFARITTRQHTTEELKHGRADTRTYIQFPLPQELKEKVRFKKLKTIGIAISRSETGGKESIEVRYFISSLKLGVKQFAKAIRSHWQIENSCHWSLDVTYREDALRTRHRHLAENLAWLRRFTLSLLKQHPKQDSLAMKRRSCGWNDDFLLQVLTTSTT